MPVAVHDPDFTLHVGAALDVLRTLPDESVDCCVTSPPYWGLRDYGTGSWVGGEPDCDHVTPGGESQNRSSTLEGGKATQTAAGEAARARSECGKCGAQRVDEQLGLEATPDAYVAAMVAVFEEVRRVLAPHGSLWLNLGDSYATNGGRGEARMAELGRPSESALTPAAARGFASGSKTGDSLKPKDLVGIPWRVAFALQAAGWYLRSDVIWSKPNPMPESITDRPTKSHEYVFLLTKRARYYFDAEAVREQFADARMGNPGTSTSKYADGAHGNASALAGKSWNEEGQRLANRPQSETLDGSDGEAPRGPNGQRATHVEGREGSIQHRSGERWPNPTGRNVRSVWTIATQPYVGAHFATFPEELPRRCIVASCPESVCATCGNPSERIVERTKYEPPTAEDGERFVDASRGDKTRKLSGADYNASVHVIGESWSDCGHDDYRRGIVLDPFMGSGTTALVARKNGRAAIGIELNPEYAALCATRLQQLSLFAEGAS